MGLLNKFSFCVVLFLTSGCGVKGRPLPPEEPAFIGRGQKTIKANSSKIDPKKRVLPADDFTEETDFPEDRDK